MMDDHRPDHTLRRDLGNGQLFHQPEFEWIVMPEEAPMRVSDAYIRQIREAVHHPWESVQASLAGVSDEVAVWAPPGYGADIERTLGWPPPGSILWHANHLLDCKRAYAHALRHAGAPSPELEEYRVRPSLEAIGEDYRCVMDDMIDAVGHIPESTWDSLCITWSGEALPLASFLNMSLRHEAWHAGQVRLVRRLYRSRE
jgi:hypothetical protein